MRGQEAGEGTGLPGQGKAASGRGDTELGAQPALGCSPHTPTMLLSPAGLPRDTGPELSTLGTVPPPHTSGLQTQLCPQLAGLIRESHSSTALRANSTGFAQTQPSTQKIISSLALLCGREQRDSTAPAATPEALGAPGAKGPTGEGSEAPAGPFPSTSQNGAAQPRVVLARGKASE